MAITLKKKIVVALGGNAIVTKTGTAASQIDSIRETMQSLVKFIKADNELVITHGNGPQVGNLLLQETNGSTQNNPAMPLDTLVAMTQGSIGYWMQKSLGEVLAQNNIIKQVTTVVTQVEVHSNDPAFENPSKPIGPFYSRHEATVQHTLHSKYVFREDAGRGYRRVVSSPKPVKIIEAPVIEKLLGQGVIPIAAGGGGIPVIRQSNGKLKGVEAVIDKDFSAAKLAEDINADELIILTNVDYVYLNYRHADQKALTKVTVDELKKNIANNQFAAGSMLPKVQAVIDFVEQTGKSAVISSLQNVAKVINGNGGTLITK